MATSIADRWNGLKNRFTGLHGFILQTHRIVGPLWLVSLAGGFLIDTSQIPGPSIPGLLFIALLITGGYLSLRPWIRGSRTVSERLSGLTQWTWTPAVVIRRTHRIAGGLFLLSLAVALAVTTAGGPEQLVLIPLVVVLLYLAITGLYLFFSPWVSRVRAG